MENLLCMHHAGNDTWEVEVMGMGSGTRAGDLQ